MGDAAEKLDASHAAPSTTEQVRARSIGGLITHAELRAKARDRMGLPPEPARLP